MSKRTPTYSSWENMIQRCYNPNSVNFKYYGGRGISACDRWRTFKNFLADMGERPAGKTLDRKNGNGNYEPANCQWSTRKEQGRNRRDNTIIECNGHSACIAEWAEKLGIHRNTIHHRIRMGWTDEQSVTGRPQPHERIIEVSGVKRSVSAWARQLGIPRTTLRRMIDRNQMQCLAMAHVRRPQ